MSDTNTAPKTATAPAQAPAKEAPAQPDFSKMTGEEAKAYVAAQKAKEAPAAKPTSTAQDLKAKANPVQANKDAISEAAAEAKRKFKIDNEEVDEDEVLKVYKSRKDHQREANKRFQEGQAARKQAEEFVLMMRDPAKLQDAMLKLGYTKAQIRQMSEKVIASELEEEVMDPRDKELKQAKAKLKEIEDLEKRQQAEVEARRHKELKAKYEREYNDQFVEALKESQLPPTKGMVAEMAKYISRSAKIGFKMTPSEAAQLVKEDVQRAQMSLIGTADGETLLKLLGDEVAAKLLQARGKQVKQPEQVLKTPTEQGEPSQRVKNSGKRMSSREWREFNRKK